MKIVATKFDNTKIQNKLMDFAVLFGLIHFFTYGLYVSVKCTKEEDIFNIKDFSTFWFLERPEK